MYGLKILFVALYLWSLCYNISYLVYCAKAKKAYTAVSSAVLCVASAALCVIYVISQQ